MDNTDWQDEQHGEDKVLSDILTQILSNINYNSNF
jgi:hypothetical protein